MRPCLLLLCGCFLPLIITIAAYTPSRWLRRGFSTNYLSKLEDVVADTKPTGTKPDVFNPMRNLRPQEPKPKICITTAEELRKAVLDDGRAFSEIVIEDQYKAAIEQQVNDTFLTDHSVLQVMKERFDTHSKPGQRNDTAVVALAIEGGGMRGCVSAGMAAAVASLGLSDSIDKVYGSSAGSVIGSYLVSRQMCVDVYVDILPAAKRLFVCKRRIVAGLAKSLVKVLQNTLRQTTPFQVNEVPGMNISFVLDSIMSKESGIRPLDITKFRQNNEHQQLRIVSSTIDEEGRLIAKCFGTDDFFGDNIAQRADGSRNGLFTCLEASMTVPAATGPPVDIHWTKGKNTTIQPFFDAFCFEPLPYRSAVEEGATHVLMLASRPLGFQPAVKPSIYETTLAPIYFYSHQKGSVARFFERGGQQYLYAEDILLLKEGKMKTHGEILVPPPKILYGLDPERRTEYVTEIRNRDQTWKKASILPIQVSPEAPELGTLEQDKDAVLEAVRGGYSAAFNLLAPLVGIEGIVGDDAAKLIFPDSDLVIGEEYLFDSDTELLQTRVDVPGDSIINHEKSIDGEERLFSGLIESSAMPHRSLFSVLPGFQDGKLHHLAKGLRDRYKDV